MTPANLHGGSDSDGPDIGKLAETRERRCPHCHAENIKLLGRFQAVSGVIKSERQCIPCGKTFVYVRNPLPETMLGRGEPREED
jgi:hypothetical protein